MNDEELNTFRLWMLNDGMSPRTIRKYVNLLKGLLRIDLDLDELSNYEIVDFMAELKRTDNAKNNLVKAINRWLRFRDRKFRLKLKTISGTRDIWIPDPAIRDKMLAFEWDTPYKTAKGRLVLRILFECALRNEECAKLQYSDFKERKICGSRKNYLDVVGKGNKRRQVPVSHDLIIMVGTFKRWYRGTSDYLFENPNTGKHISTKFIRDLCKVAGKGVGCEQFHPHTARHFRAVEWKNEGFQIEDVKKLLGHAKIETTMIYFQGAGDTDLFLKMYDRDRYYKKNGSTGQEGL